MTNKPREPPTIDLSGVRLRPHRWAELAFDLAQPHWGKGLMRHAVAGLLEWTYRQDEIDRLHAFVRVDNGRSIRLAAAQPARGG